MKEIIISCLLIFLILVNAQTCSSRGYIFVGGECIPCNAGQTNNNDDTACIDCPAGTYSNSGTQCFSCATGDISGVGSPFCSPCDPGQTSNDEHTICVDCPAGTYSNSGTQCFSCATGDIAPFKGQPSCTPCPAGSSSNDEHTICELCPPGTRAGSEGSSCSTCISGSIAPNPGTVQCQSCIPGTESNDEHTECIPCTPGNGRGTSCLSCFPGDISTEGEICYPCSSGYGSNAEHTSCDICDPGTASFVGNTCSSCFSNEFQPNSGSGDCIECPNGYKPSSDKTICEVCSENNALSFGSSCNPCSISFVSLPGTECFRCPPGKTNAIDYTDCSLTPPGSYSSIITTFCDKTSIQPLAGQDSCTNCPTNHYADNSRTLCIPCPAGTVLNFDDCVHCGSGRFNPTPGETCQECSPGYTHNQDHTGCIPCPAGSYERFGVCVFCNGGISSTGATECTPCESGFEPNGKNTACIPNGSFSGCTNFQMDVGGSCVDCPYGQSADSSGTSCVYCTIGHEPTFMGCMYCDDDEISPDGSFCSTCPFSLVPNEDHTACVRCPNGYIRISDTVCEPCAPNEYSSSDDDDCHECPLGQVPNNDFSGCIPLVCTPPEIVFNLAIGIAVCYNPTLPDPCPNGQQLEVDQCVSCPVNTYSNTDKNGICVNCPRGTSTNGLDGQSSCTSCADGFTSDGGKGDCIMCEVGLYRDPVTNICYSCPAGFTSDDGINCTPCPAGTSTKGVGGTCEMCREYEIAPFDGSSCLVCPPGTQADNERLVCVPCEPGTYSSGGEVCRLCDSDSFADFEGAKYCIECPYGYIGNLNRTSCTACNCLLCGNGITGCTNTDALNYNVIALRDDGSCKYEYSEFVSDVVACPNEELPNAQNIYTYDFNPFYGAAGLKITAMEIGLVAYFDNPSLITVDLISPFGTRINLISPGDYTSESCLLNVRYHSQEIPFVNEIEDSCIIESFEVPCSNFFSSNLLKSELNSVLSETPTGQWSLEITGSIGEFIRAQLVYSQYFQYQSNYIMANEQIDYISCTELSNNRIELTVSETFGNTLQMGNILSGYLCNTFVIKIDTIIPDTGFYTIHGNYTGLENVFSELKVNNLVPDNTELKRGELEFNLLDITESTGVVQVDSILNVQGDFNVKISAVLNIDIGLLAGIKKVSLENVGTITITTIATLGFSEGGSFEGSAELFDRLVGTGVFTIGAVPIPFEVRLQANTGYEVAVQVSSIATATSELTYKTTFGFKYEKDKGFDPIAKASSSVNTNFEIDHQCTASALAFLGPSFVFGIGKEGILFIPLTLNVEPYVGTSFTQSQEANTECCSNNALEASLFWGVRSSIDGALELGSETIDEHSIDISDRKKIISKVCFPTIPFPCPAVNCSQLPQQSSPNDTVPLQASTEANVFGDPHFISLDECSFTFQGFGEFLLMESLDNPTKPPFILQGRFQELSPRSPYVSYTTTIAVSQDVTRSVLVFGLDINPHTDPYSVAMNNKIINVPVDCPYEFDGGVIFRPSESKFNVEFDRGYTVSIKFIRGTLGYSISVPSTAYKNIIGLLGSFDGIKENQFIGRDNLTYSICEAVSSHNRCTEINSWGDTFLISQEESLFYYKSGQNTTTFYKPTPVVSNNCAVPVFATQEEEDTAHLACANVVSDINIFNSCLWDIAQTNDFEAVTTSSTAFEQSLLSGIFVLNLQVSMTSSNSLLIDWDTPDNIPSEYSTETISYEVQYSQISNNILNAGNQDNWITIVSNSIPTEYNYFHPFNESVALSIRVKPLFPALEGSGNYIIIEFCLPICTNDICCDGCNVKECLSCPIPTFDCIPPLSTCSEGFYDNQKLFFIINCEECSKDEYSDIITGDNGRCKICPETTNTNNTTGSISLNDCGCNIGFGNPNNPTPICEECPINTYSPNWTRGDIPCTPCPGLATTDGQSGSLMCGCDPGYESLNGNPDIISCTQCQSGYISDSFTNPGILCTPCNAGQSSDISFTSCINCLAGQSSIPGGPCINCLAGQSSVEGGLCLPCPAGKSSIPGGLCENCNAGFSSTSGGICLPCQSGQTSISGGTCFNCPAGSSSESGDDSCTNCLAGQTSISGGACFNCSAGTSSESGDDSCTNCPAGESSIEGGICIPCLPGEISVSGGQCTPCPAGKEPNINQISCQDCTPGYFSVEGGTCQQCATGTSSPVGSSTCDECPAGQSSVTGGLCTNCLAGQSSIQGGLCENCTAGTSSISGGNCIECLDGFKSVSGGNCTECPDGFTSTSPHTECFECVGQVCDCTAGELAANGECTPCPAGTSSVFPYATCDNCTAGQSSFEGGLCQNCSAGQSSVSGGQCNPCNAGQSSFEGGLCEDCTAGTSSVSGGICLPCPAGQSSISGGLCENCNAGFSSTSGGICLPCQSGQTSISGGTCFNCTAGSSSESGDDSCTNCLAGQFSEEGGPCLPCPTGQSSIEGGECFSCPAGQSSIEGGLCTNCLDGQISIEGGECINCSAGSSSTSGESNCTLCAAGTSSIEGGLCTNCIAGYISEEDGALCSPCPALSSSTEGSTTCFLCESGFSSEEGGLCTECPAGSYSIQNVTNGCEFCAAGTSSEVGSPNCTPCEDGESSIEGGLCEVCPDGSTAISGGTCFECPAGTFSTNGSECQSCPSGTSSNNGDISCTNCPSGQSSTEGGLCEDCTEGHISQSGGLCEICPPGTTPDLNNRANCINCEAGTSSSNGVCLPCAEGSSSITGGLCEECLAGTSTNGAGSPCEPCDEGFISNSGAVMCIECDIGFTSNENHTECIAGSSSSSPIVSPVVSPSSAVPSISLQESTSPTFSFTVTSSGAITLNISPSESTSPSISSSINVGTTSVIPTPSTSVSEGVTSSISESASESVSLSSESSLSSTIRISQSSLQSILPSHSPTPSVTSSSASRTPTASPISQFDQPTDKNDATVSLLLDCSPCSNNDIDEIVDILLLLLNEAKLIKDDSPSIIKISFNEDTSVLRLAFCNSDNIGTVLEIINDGLLPGHPNIEIVSAMWTDHCEFDGSISFTLDTISSLSSETTFNFFNLSQSSFNQQSSSSKGNTLILSFLLLILTFILI